MTLHTAVLDSLDTTTAVHALTSDALAAAFAIACGL